MHFSLFRVLRVYSDSLSRESGHIAKTQSVNLNWMGSVPLQRFKVIYQIPFLLALLWTPLHMDTH